MRPPMASKLMVGAEVKPWPGLRMVRSATCRPVTPDSEETFWLLAPLALPSWSTPLAEPAPEPRKSSAAVGRRLLAPPPSTRVPLATVVAPLKVLVAARVSEPVPALVRPPIPTPTAPPMALAKTRLLAPTSNVPPAERKVTPRWETSSLKPGKRRKVPPAKVSGPALPPMLASEPIARTPSLIVVPQ